MAHTGKSFAKTTAVKIIVSGLKSVIAKEIFIFILKNRPFYRYGGHLEFRGNYGMPRGQMRNN